MGNYLVTGGAGFIGSHLVEHLVGLGHRVTVIDNLSTGHLSNLASVEGKITFVEGSVADGTLLEKVLPGTEGVFHQAAIPSVPRSVAEPLETQQSGEVATLMLLQACVHFGVRRVLYAGSSSVYGDTPTLPKREDMAPSPKSPYAVSKLAGECYMTAFARCHPVDTATLRYFNVFGPRQDPSSPYSGVMAKFSSRMRRGERPAVNGDGLQTRDFTYVDNAIQANLKAMFCPGPLAGAVMNVASGRRASLLDVIERFNQVLGTSLKPEFLPARPGDVRDSLADLEEAKTRIGYVPTVSWEEGVGKLLEHDGRIGI